MEEVEKNEQQIQEKKGMSIASMVLGIVGIVMFRITCGVLAIIFSILGRKKGGKEFATAGLVLGIIDCSMGAIIILIVVGIFASIL